MAVPVTTDHMDLRRRRNAARPRITLDDMAAALGLDPDATRPALSRWERGKGSLPTSLTRADYERVIARLERERAS